MNNNNNNNELDEFTTFEYFCIQLASLILSTIALFGICCVAWIIILTSYKSVNMIFEYFFNMNLHF